jgi:hypothetical protein
MIRSLFAYQNIAKSIISEYIWLNAILGKNWSLNKVVLSRSHP